MVDSAMPNSADNSCPFCGARFSPGSSACPVCDLPLFDPNRSERSGRTGRRRAANGPAPFDGAALFDDAYSEDFDEAFLREAPMATERAWERSPSRRTESMRCVVVAINQAEADMLEDMLRAEGIPCMTRTIGSPTPPDFLAIARREVLVPESALAAARDLLRIDTPLVDHESTAPFTFAATVFAGLIAVALCVALILGLS
jgi:hypothetical protein